MPVYQCDGTDILDVAATSETAIEAARTERKPVAIVFSNLTRRFGHAATDRQAAYLSTSDIQAAADTNPLEFACHRLVSLGVTTYEQLHRLYTEIDAKVQAAFQSAATERKIETREEVIASTAQPLAAFVPRTPDTKASPEAFPDVMRKHMTRVIVEQLEANPNMVYIGEVWFAIVVVCCLMFVIGHGSHSGIE